MIDEGLLRIINYYTKFTHDISITKEQIIEEIDKLIPEEHTIYLEENVDYFFNFINTERQSAWSNNKKQENAKKLIEQIKNKEQPEQRTDEWYKYRYTMLTASSIWKIFKSNSTQNELIQSKKKPLDLSKYKNINTESPLHWGHKYEPVSVLLYENMFNTQVGDFGCIKHDNYNFIGASPDGINIKEKNNLYGRMLEIKNIVNRQLNGIPKYEYWIQMQIQMEVCNLDYCDFLECKFIEYKSYDEFINDGTFNFTQNHMRKGIIVQLFNGIEPKYFYPPLDIDSNEFDNWKDNIIDNNLSMSWIRDIYWYYDEHSCVLVERNKEWFKHSIDDIKFIWSKII